MIGCLLLVSLRFSAMWNATYGLNRGIVRPLCAVKLARSASDGGMVVGIGIIRRGRRDCESLIHRG